MLDLLWFYVPRKVVGLVICSFCSPRHSTVFPAPPCYEVFVLPQKLVWVQFFRLVRYTHMNCDSSILANPNPSKCCFLFANRFLKRDLPRAMETNVKGSQLFRPQKTNGFEDILVAVSFDHEEAIFFLMLMHWSVDREGPCLFRPFHVVFFGGSAGLLKCLGWSDSNMKLQHQRGLMWCVYIYKYTHTILV